MNTHRDEPQTRTFLRVEQDGPIVTWTMSDPERRNPLTGNRAVPEFLAEIDRVHADPEVRVVILTGEGSAFSSGGNVKDMARHASGEMEPMALRREYRLGIQRLPLALFDLEVPVVAAINGHAVGAGLDLACMCDIRVASERATFAESFVKLGLIPGDGGAWLLPRIVGLARATELTLTGQTIDARQAAEWHLVSRVVPHDELIPTARAIAEAVAANPPHAVRLAKRLLREALHTRLETLLEMSAAFQAIAHQTADHREAVAAFMEKRKPMFGGPERR